MNCVLCEVQDETEEKGEYGALTQDHIWIKTLMDETDTCFALRINKRPI
jgi:hypothetical protein